eukprot:maker-scaffold_11-snap-gene-0.1-mRNA-1 protein AED:0.35 eAED:0.40 QI:0/0/0/0.75/0.66/0.5/4/0/348
MESKRIWKKDFGCTKVKGSTQSNPVFCVRLSSDGVLCLIAVERSIYVLDAETGKEIKVIKSHEKSVYSVDFSHDNNLFASGGADKLVILWTKDFKGRLKYSHESSVQCLKFSNVKHQLLTCSGREIVMCNAEIKKVRRTKTEGRIISCEWTLDSSMYSFWFRNISFSIGYESGEVEIRDAETMEVYRILGKGAPVFCVTFMYEVATDYQEEETKLLLGSWDETIALHSMHSEYCYFEKKLGFLPCSICVFSCQSLDYILVAGSNGSCTVFSREGFKLGVIVEQPNSWILTTAISSAPTWPAVKYSEQSFSSLEPSSLHYSPIVVLYGSSQSMVELCSLSAGTLECTFE